MDNKHIEQVEHLICQMSLSEAFAQLETWELKTDLDKRIMFHLKGVAFIHAGDLAAAKTSLLTAYESYGENISLIRDIACLYYQTGEMTLWREWYRRLERKMGEHQAQLSLDVIVRAAVVLGKFYEAEGFETKALSLYLKTYDRLKLENRSDLYYLCLPQLLRLQSHHGNSDALGQYYSELISLRKSNLNADIAFEIHHSLMLAEMVLIGPDHAWARVLSSLEDEKLQMADRRLIFYDFIEGALSRKWTIPSHAKSLSTSLKDHDAFEVEIHQLVFQTDLRRDWLRLSELASELSWGCYLRVLILHLSQSSGTDAVEIKNKINLVLSSLDAESRSYWLQRMKPFLISQDLTLSFAKEKRMVCFQNKEIDLSKKKGMLTLLQALADQRTRSVEDVIQMIWSSPYSPEYYHRLRMTAHRLNQLLFDLTTIPKIIEVSADEVSLRPTVTFASSSMH